MSLVPPSRTTRLLLRIAPLGLAGLLAGMLSGCSSNTAAQMLQPRIDPDWQTTSTYASATAILPARSAVRSAHARVCSAAPCEQRVAGNRTHHHRM
jgi:hypothetical protein